MAMYVMEEMPDIHGTGEQVLYPRFAMIDQVSTEDLIRQIASVIKPELAVLVCPIGKTTFPVGENKFSTYSE